MNAYEQVIKALESGDIAGNFGDIKVYPRSFERHEGTSLVMVKDKHVKYLIAAGSGPLFDELQGESLDGGKRCPLNHENRLVVNKFFEYTVPRAFGTQIATIGLGDRLGLASPGHIQTIRGRNIRPILAQQSIRELNLTGRDYKQVVDAASFAALQEGYKDGFGADGDHLKAEADIRMALDLGFTMLTLDCSEKIDNTVEGSSAQSVEDRYSALPAVIRAYFEEKYLNKAFRAGEHAITFDKPGLMKDVLIYGEAVKFMEHIYNTYITTADRNVDFEISIDETATPTNPSSHFLIANELYGKGISIYSMAPRFCGEFQKGIDYIGDLGQFEQELAVHAAIADHFGYKLSIHSGSDKFSVFPIIARYTKGRFHVKTAGTNWLEAVRTAAKANPSLYRSMHQYALEHFEEAKAYYHVTTDIGAIKPLEQIKDEDLHEYMNENNARQLLHITYGILLQAVKDDGTSRFKEEFFRTLSEGEEQFEASLAAHIGKHLDLLGK